MKLQEHIDLYRKLRIPFKPQFLSMALELCRQHYNQELDALVEPTTNETMTFEEFIKAVITPETPEPKKATPKKAKK